MPRREQKGGNGTWGSAAVQRKGMKRKVGWRELMGRLWGGSAGG